MARRYPLQKLSRSALARLRKICLATNSNRIVNQAANCSNIILYRENGTSIFREDTPPARLARLRFTEVGEISRFLFSELPYGPWEYILGKGQIPWEDKP
jgi:hypothetical protein